MKGMTFYASGVRKTFHLLPLPVYFCFCVSENSEQFFFGATEAALNRAGVLLRPVQIHS